MHETIWEVSLRYIVSENLQENDAGAGGQEREWKCSIALCAFQRAFRRGRRGSRFHEWDATAVKSHRWVNLYQLTPIIASARAEIRGQNEPTLAC